MALFRGDRSGLRPQEVIKLKRSNMKEDGFLVEITKTKHSVGKKIITWTDELKKAVEEIDIHNEKLETNVNHLLCSSKGEPYTYDGFSSIWHRLMKKALKDKIITKSFQFRDIRHKAATDMERLYGRETARQLLGHTNQNTTARYIDKAPIVRAVK